MRRQLISKFVPSLPPQKKNKPLPPKCVPGYVPSIGLKNTASSAMFRHYVRTCQIDAFAALMFNVVLPFCRAIHITCCFCAFSLYRKFYSEYAADIVLYIDLINYTTVFSWREIFHVDAHQRRCCAPGGRLNIHIGDYLHGRLMSFSEHV